MSSRPKNISKERILNTNGSVDSRAIQTSLDRLVDNSNALTNVVLSRARLIKNVTVTSGQTTNIKHGLGRELQGYLVVLSTVSSIINDLQSTNNRKSTELWLQTTTTTTINILVF